MGRELGRLSRLIHGGDCFKVLAIFAQRPKLAIEPSSSIFIKINYELLEVETICREFGIPVIVGCPTVYNFWDLDKHPQIVWLDLAALDETVLELKKGATIGIDGGDVLDLVNTAAELSFPNFDRFLKLVRSLSSNFYGSTYKPFYFLIK